MSRAWFSYDARLYIDEMHHFALNPIFPQQVIPEHRFNQNMPSTTAGLWGIKLNMDDQSCSPENGIHLIKKHYIARLFRALHSDRHQSNKVYSPEYTDLWHLVNLITLQVETKAAIH